MDIDEYDLDTYGVTLRDSDCNCTQRQLDAVCYQLNKNLFQSFLIAVNLCIVLQFTDNINIIEYLHHELQEVTEIQLLTVH